MFCPGSRRWIQKSTIEVKRNVGNDGDTAPLRVETSSLNFKNKSQRLRAQGLGHVTKWIQLTWLSRLGALLVRLPSGHVFNWRPSETNSSCPTLSLAQSESPNIAVPIGHTC